MDQDLDGKNLAKRLSRLGGERGRIYIHPKTRWVIEVFRSLWEWLLQLFKRS